MSEIDDGGPAFARPCSEDRASELSRDRSDMMDAQPGMSLRDYFAAKAMQALIGLDIDVDVSATAHDSFMYADEMIAARKAKP